MCQSAVEGVPTCREGAESTIKNLRARKFVDSGFRKLFGFPAKLRLDLHVSPHSD